MVDLRAPVLIFCVVMTVPALAQQSVTLPVLPETRPNPDPTLLTTELTRREINHLQELLEAKFLAMSEKAKFDISASQRAIELVATNSEDRRVALKDGVTQRFEALKEAALATQYFNTEAIRKSELATANELLSLKAMIGTAKDAANQSIGDLRSRLDRGEGSAGGSAATQTTTFALIGLAISLIVAVISVVGLFMRQAAAPPVHQTAAHHVP